MKATPSDKKYFFVMRDAIYKQWKEEGYNISKAGITAALKIHAELEEDCSLADIDHEPFQYLKFVAKELALIIGVDPKDRREE